jgi:hypothetical protein
MSEKCRGPFFQSTSGEVSETMVACADCDEPTNMEPPQNPPLGGVALTLELCETPG